MDFNFSDEQLAIRESVRDLVRDRVAPRAAEIDRSGEYPHDIERLFAENGILGIPFPEEYGGLSGSSVTICMVTEEIARACATSALILGVHALGAYSVLLGGSEEQKRRILPELARGRLTCYALTEPDAGSDAGALRLSARRLGDEYVLNGIKTFITHASVAETMIVFARTGGLGPGGVSAFFLERERSPWRVLKVETKMGIRGSPTAQIAFDDVIVPAANRLGLEGQGFKIALGVLDRSRPGVAAQAVGIAQGALDFALEYAKQRHQFGHPIASFQGLQWMLADMATQIEAARQLLYFSAWKVDRGDPDMTRAAAMSKMFCSDMAMKVTTDAVQILGGYGYISDYPVERMMRDAKITQIYEGTNQVQRLVIARALIG
ncbi:MAG TPA: acyl-CoA dehydrogenase family protein [Candidatus Acidoferrales bacterium]|nr:acyl-CoA dehydrogenase family protein [Candidatus Acidoferrales bacterium]